MTADPDDILNAAPSAGAFFDGFEEIEVPVGEGHVFCRIGGVGPPLLLLHGYPQTSAMWHKVAPRLAERYQVICADLRGYGRSSKPASGPGHLPYTKRATADELVAALRSLGHGRVLVGAHDRGARVAHRMAADHPDMVRALAILDIAPTREMYAGTTAGFAADYWHWFWLIRPFPIPEQMIGRDPAGFWVSKFYGNPIFEAPFSKEALAEYLGAFNDPATIHASCEDYRAAYTTDIDHDNAEAGPIEMPLQVLWGQKGAIEKHFDCLALWRLRATQVSGHSLPGGHFLAEELPDMVLDAWLPFFANAP